MPCFGSLFRVSDCLPGSDLLLTTDRTPFHVVTYFLMQSLSKVGLHGKWFKELKGVYPVVDKTMESDFRKIVADFFSSLQKETDFHFKKNTFSRILMYPGKDSFLHLYLSFSNLVLTKECSRETLQQIRSFKSHQSVDDSVMENISDISKVLTDTSEAKENLITCIFEFKKRLSNCQQERKDLVAVSDTVAAEWLAVFPEQDVGEGTCDRYIRQVLDLKSQLKHDVLCLVQQLDSDLRMSVERSSSLNSVSGINVVRRMREWTVAAKGAASSLRNGKIGMFFLFLSHHAVIPHSFGKFRQEALSQEPNDWSVGPKDGFRNRINAKGSDDKKRVRNRRIKSFEGSST